MCKNLGSDKSAYSYILLCKMIIKFNIFRTNMKHRINRHVKSVNIVTNNYGGLERNTPISHKK